MKQFLLLGLVLVGVWVVVQFFVLPALPVCDYEVAQWGRGRGEEGKRCQCQGIKITTEDSLARDGKYETVCLGVSK